MSASNELSSQQVTSSTIDDFDDLDRTLDLINLIESIDAEMQIQRLKTFILVARYPGLNTQQLAQKAGMTSASMSRNLSSLGDWNPLAKKEGYGLVYGCDLRDDRRNKIHTLTHKGKEIRIFLRSIWQNYGRTVLLSSEAVNTVHERTSEMLTLQDTTKSD
jgi:DNA-binding MarR family transcriptional regulator